MPLFNGEEMRRKLDENLRRLQIQTQVERQTPAVENLAIQTSNGQQSKS